MRIPIHQDVVAGVLFLSVGACGLWLGSGYAVGTATRMGPGYLPHLLSWLLVGFGIVIAFKGYLSRSELLFEISLRPVAFVLLSFFVFAALLERFGLATAAIATVLTAAFAGSGFRWREQLILAIGLAGCSVILFVVLLGLPIRALPF